MQHRDIIAEQLFIDTRSMHDDYCVNTTSELQLAMIATLGGRIIIVITTYGNTAMKFSTRCNATLQYTAIQHLETACD